MTSSASRRAIRPGRTGSFAIVGAAYLLTVAVFPIVLSVMDAHPLTEVLVADLVATLVIFAFSFWTDNSSMYDAYWSVIPPVIVGSLLLAADPGVSGLRQALVLGAVTIWGIRLTANWARTWTGLGHEDWRYVLARENGKPYWPQAFGGFHLFPTLIVLLCLIAADPAVRTSTAAVGPLDIFAFLVMLTGVLLEFVADHQMHRFNQTKQSGDICTDGLWAWCRHPNYLGEMTFWFGLWLAGLAADPSWWWTLVGPVAMTVMFRFASIPMIDNRGIERRPGYQEHMQRVPMVLPRRPQ